MGDGVLIYFGYPQAHEEDAERATGDGGDSWSGQRLPAGAGDCYAVACG
jgi:hypothetical protein